ncbi:retrotransposon protein [Cucumis melo var. makuwa]|uniref:Retrotransposon protein n=1 Tax=Cucumis melo var. makuwa TaxID=1194695 RepID=A0A5A7TAW0_CUCMM|nr:retrotransposon protein [Cucumis melo var. makuwa]TYK05636.1 retrotransposon protein [Cucumis melo var. makuwa]
MEGWKYDNGTFWPSYLAQLVRMMAEKILGCQVRATTIIDCKIKTLKRTFQAIAEMWGPACSGLDWNVSAKCIIAEKELFDNWVRSILTTGRFAETFADVGSNKPVGARSSGSKSKRRIQRKTEPEVIHMALECINNQLRTIADWPVRALANDNHVHLEFFRILREMSKLTSLDMDVVAKVPFISYGRHAGFRTNA